MTAAVDLDDWPLPDPPEFGVDPDELVDDLAWADFVESMTAEDSLIREVGTAAMLAVTLHPTLDADEAWARCVRVPPRPLPGVTGVVGADLAPALASVDPLTLSPAQLVELVTGAERLSRWAHSVQLAAVAAFADYATISDEDTRDHPLASPPGVPGGPGRVETGFSTQREIEEFCADGIAAALGVTYTRGQRLIDTAYFARDVTVAAGLLAAGQTDLARMQVFAAELAPVGYTSAEQLWVDTTIVDTLALTPRQLQRTLRTRVMAHQPDGHAAAHHREKLNRGVWVNPKPAGMATLCAYLTADEARLAYQAVNAAAWNLHDTTIATGQQVACEEAPHYRRFDTYRADALINTLTDLHTTMLTAAGADIPTSTHPTSTHPSGTGPSGTDPTSTGSPSGTVVGEGVSPRRSRRLDPARVMLHVYMAAPTLAGLDDQPADLLGYGPIDADHARTLIEGAAVTRILTDPFSGEIRAVDTPAYRIPRILRWAVQARDRQCTFPACDIPAYDTQTDHVIPHPAGRKLQKALATGMTSYDNLQSLCQHHHRLKTHTGWTIQTTHTGRIEWISPTGHSYRRNPEWGPPATFRTEHPPSPPIPEIDICPF